MSDDADMPLVDLVGYEWEQAVKTASAHGLQLHQEFTVSPKGPGRGTLRVIRQVTRGNEIWCVCAAEEWGDRPC